MNLNIPRGWRDRDPMSRNDCANFCTYEAHCETKQYSAHTHWSILHREVVVLDLTLMASQ